MKARQLLLWTWKAGMRRKKQETQRREVDHRAVTEAWNYSDLGRGSARHRTQGPVARWKGNGVTLGRWRDVAQRAGSKERNRQLPAPERRSLLLRHFCLAYAILRSTPGRLPLSDHFYSCCWVLLVTGFFCHIVWWSWTKMHTGGREPHGEVWSHLNKELWLHCQPKGVRQYGGTKQQLDGQG
ncbi:hypothetical protein CRENBAI_011489 [Crenichthys baileyi]|uniref:Uncharacterized protein n=1 Tax=Crenichthys baileyi TaxID=28760 RepID=A0AAV9R1D6_9TELE